MKKTVLVFSVIFLSAVLLSGCSVRGRPTQKKELTVYVLDISPKRWIECDVWSFNFPEFKKEHEAIDIMTVAFTSIEELEAQLLQELSNGGGPDLVLYSWQNSFDIYKLAAGGLFMDLNTYLKDDDTYHREEYMESLLDSGVIGGGQYLMPVGYMLPILLTSEEKLQEAGVPYTGEPFSGRELLQMIESEGMRLAEDDEHFAFIDFQQGNSSSAFFEYSGVIVSDYEALTVSVDPDTFFECMQLNSSFLNELRHSISTLTKNGSGTGYQVSGSELLEKGTFFHATFSPFKEIINYAFSIQYMLEETPILQMQPSFTSADTYYVNPLFAAVNRSCAEPDAAYELIRYLMDHPVQQGADGIAPESYFSVNKSVSIAYLQSIFDTVNPNGSASWQIVEKQFFETFNSFLSSEVGCCLPWGLVNTIFKPCREAADESREAFDAALDVQLAEMNAYFVE